MCSARPLAVGSSHLTHNAHLNKGASETLACVVIAVRPSDCPAGMFSCSQLVEISTSYITSHKNMNKTSLEGVEE